MCLCLPAAVANAEEQPFHRSRRHCASPAPDHDHLDREIHGHAATGHRAALCECCTQSRRASSGHKYYFRQKERTAAVRSSVERPYISSLCSGWFLEEGGTTAGQVGRLMQCVKVYTTTRA